VKQGQLKQVEAARRLRLSDRHVSTWSLFCSGRVDALDHVQLIGVRQAGGSIDV
jgi:hypothetical protein